MAAVPAQLISNSPLDNAARPAPVQLLCGSTNAWELAAGVWMGVILPALVFLAFRVAAVLAEV
jgi:hypothetical protein